MNLPSFLWRWLAAWLMILSITLYIGLALTGVILRIQRLQPNLKSWRWLRLFHYSAGVVLVVFVLILLTIGIAGTLKHHGSLGHSWHFLAGLLVTALTLGSAWSASRIHPKRPWARPLHLGLNGMLLLGLVLVSSTGWSALQKYSAKEVLDLSISH